ncbi:MAG: carboxypeptidase regulatory-like domain-containing protein [Phycisphaerales bacterium]|nr:MAG: carboxypeptidase regulatory-like domain-containing protein [Phycisphaerales bacterium]
MRLFSSALLMTLAFQAAVVSALAQERQPRQRQAREPRPAKDFIVVEGQITHANGAGHQGVTVTVRKRADDGSEGKLIGNATTDELGDFKVTAPEPIRGEIIVTFSKPDYVNLIRQLDAGEDTFPPFIAEVLEGNRVLTGRVLDADTEEPIAGAHVGLRTRDADWHDKTDAEGQFTLRGLSPGRGTLVVEATGYGRERSALDEGVGLQGSADITVSLKPERVVHIKLADELGKPISGVTVECYDKARDDVRSAVTDGSGSVTVRGIHVDARTLDVRLTHDDHVSSSGFDRAITLSTKGVESTHRLAMGRAGRITGKVTDARTGEALNGARLLTGGGYFRSSPRDWADYRGLYTIRGVRPGSTVVTVHLSGYAPELKTVEVEPAKSARLDVRLGPGTVLKGIVKGEDGKPVPGAYVETVRWRGYTTLGLRAATGADGHFALENAPQDEFEIAVAAPRAGRVTKTVKVTPNEVVEITLPGAPADSHTSGVSGPSVGDAAPVLELTDLDGKMLNLADLSGKTILLSFWATWCPTCVKGLPQLVKVHEEFAARKDFVMISISRDFDEGVLRSFLKKNGDLKWHQVFGEAGGAQTAAERFGVTSVPQVFIIGPGGKIAAKDLQGEDIVKHVEKMLRDGEPE